MTRLRNILKNEEGNAILFTMGLLSVMMILFVFVLNLTQALAVKEKANTTAQQASLAATAVLYDEIWYSIAKYEQTIIGMVDSYPETIAEKVDKRANQLRGNPAYSEDSSNEIDRKALNQVLSEELTSGIGPYELRIQLESDLNFTIIPLMKQAAADVILANEGNLSESAMKVFEDERIHVKASNTVESTPYGKYLKGIEKKLFQESAGPKIDFVKYLSVNQTISFH